jgi:tetratricopeptide (TPR) repeat protein
LLLATYLSSQSLFAEAAEKPKLLARAENSARTALKGMKQPTADAYFRLADILEDEGSYAESEVAFKRALDQSRASKDKGWEASSLRGLIRVSYALDHRSDGERWFEALRASGSANAFDYRSQAERLYKVASFLGSAHAYESAAVSSEGVWTDWCQAKLSYSLADSADDVLRAGRKCIELGSGQPDSEKELEWAHLSIAGVLNERGVYEEALSHSREAIALDSSDAFAYGNMADALYGLHRYQETINAAKQAIRLSDGKYAGMHFRLGAAYFETENWQFAKDSFEKAAQLEPKDDAAAYNVAVSLGRMGFYKDAASWYEEVLRRNPNHKDRDEITRTIQNFRR